MVLSRQHIIVREEMKFARNDIADIKALQQDVLFLLHNMFVAGQERVKSLDSRAEREKTKSQVRLNDLSEKLESDFTSVYLTDATGDKESPSDSSPTTASEAMDAIKQDNLPDANSELPAKSPNRESQFDSNQPTTSEDKEAIKQDSLPDANRERPKVMSTDKVSKYPHPRCGSYLCQPTECRDRY